MARKIWRWRKIEEERMKRPGKYGGRLRKRAARKEQEQENMEMEED